MTETVSRGRKGDLVQKLFAILAHEPEGLRAADAIHRLAEKTQLTDYETGSYKSGARRFDKIVRFITIAFVKAGWMIKADGIWFVTDSGKQALSEYPDPTAFYGAAIKLYRSWKKSRDAEETIEDEVDGDATEVDDARSVTFEDAQDQAWLDIERHLNTMDPYELQKLVGDLLAGMGYHVAWIAPPGKDGGVDLIAFTDPLGTQGPRIKVQVKRLTTSRVDIDGLKAFLASVGNTDVGIFVALAGFTRDAQDYARNQENRRMTLIDSRRLVELWVEHYKNLTDQARQRLPLSPIYFLTPLA